METKFLQGSDNKASPRGARQHKHKEIGFKFVGSNNGRGLLVRMLVPLFLLLLLARHALILRWTLESEAHEESESLIIETIIKSDLIEPSVPVKKIPNDVLEVYENVGHCPPSLLLPSYGSQVSCNLTVVRMDPRFGNTDAKRSIWFSLESIAFFNPEVCVALLTTTCVSQQHTRDMIYDRSLPHFKKMIEQKRVRVGFLDRHNPPIYEYFFEPCGKVAYNPTAILMHNRFWIDEFTQQDPDMVLILQDDCALCRPIQYDSTWAYAGAPWSPTHSKIFHHPPEGKCQEIQNKFQQMRPALLSRWLHTKNNLTDPPPSQLFRDTLDRLQDCKEGVIGNGGFSLRSRTWMKRIIQLCPHRGYYALPAAMEGLVHKFQCLSEEPNEDIYFVTMLYGLEAPMPTHLEAAEFAVEGLFLEDLLAGRFNTDADYLGQGGSLPRSNSNSNSTPSYPTNNNKTRRQQLPSITVQGKKLTIPVAFHKPWLYIPKSIVLSPELTEACPFLHFVFDPKDVKYN